MGKRHSFGRFFLNGILAVLLIFFSVGCGRQEEQEETGQGSQAYDVDFWEREGFGFVTEDVHLEGDAASFRNLCFAGERLYYSKVEENGEVSFYVQENGEEKILPLQFPSYEEGISCVVKHLLVDEEGKIILLCRFRTLEETQDGILQYAGDEDVILGYASNGEQIFRVNISALQTLSAPGTEPEYAALDKEGRICIAGSDKILLFDENGEYRKNIIPQEREKISALVTGKDGVVYACIQNTAEKQNAAFAAIDFKKGDFSRRYGNISLEKVKEITAGKNCDFLLSDGNGLYEYSLEAESLRHVTDYQQCGIFGSIMKIQELEEGAFFLQTYENGTVAYRKLVWKETEEDEKISLVLGVMKINDQHRSDVVRFNISNSRYEIEIREYMKEDIAVKDAVARLNADIVSGNGPDILDVSAEGISVQSYVSQGLLTDLGPLMDESRLISKEDFLDSVIKAYTVKDCLVGIPSGCLLNCMIGSVSTVGDINSISVEDMISLIEEHPDIPTMSGYRTVSSYEAEWGVTAAEKKAELLEKLFRYNADFILDYEEESCKFNSPEFRSLIELAEKCVPASAAEGSGKALFHTGAYSDFQADFMGALFAFGGGKEAAVVSYPRLDGSCRIFIEPAGDGIAYEHLPVYSILSSGQNQQGAWEFVEGYLAGESNDHFFSKFSTKKAHLQWEINNVAAVYPGSPYKTDENGNVVLDAEGNPVRRVIGGARSSNGYSVDYYVPMQEEWDDYFFLIENACMVPLNEKNVYSVLIEEEMMPYFAGEKGLEEALDILQRRAALYMSEGNF